MPNFIITALLNGTLFFATQPPSHKIFTKSGHCYSAQELTQRITPEIKNWYAQDGEHNPVLNELVDTFIAHLHNNGHKKYSKPPLVIFDIDETVLTAYSALSASLASAQKISYARSSAISTMTVLQPFQRLYSFLIDHGYAVAFVSGRRDSQSAHAGIAHKFKTSGFGTFTTIFLYSARGITTARWKESARKQLAKDYTIIATIDDDWRNLVGENVGDYALWVPGYILNRPQEHEFYEQLMTLQTHHAVTVASRTYNTALSCT